MRSVRVLEAAAWYEAQRVGLGVGFRLEFKSALDTLRESHLDGAPWPGRLGESGVNRILMKRFPFSIVFVATGEAVVVLAIAHHRRRPAYWRQRLSNVK